ncbi:bifunctional 2-polyprenyl-6-hydroxyphenol methylase/3-demethylubiquinol 3-O-methyltransferase UbiG [Porticoccaceae bacterium]|jgi:2-polyprenyl-6-hydroxyphenyl methylase/3-demethylubiquinone-9 3-methyltransferase|nr:bifunctional 2-polyprenyl-6-hydroxyphenol methylase/3-demethylubiquinol 3-O-methyltransferase UbiG [Porticoccaceae bacterium]MBT6318623.1 bifunctional 2-polyprenyl-6-hydroxyphenol methylase/3-demethylubiquinol 3-O-methyltransferase UbiG [Porticoccaceae bacterium]MBT7257429.1 bifunctional 2-polyprenyl-6-hydroxyphenol methylase/3-demethylubiquinol 3-O-methyltransferase UbiG [Porticoccaceae bacterium]MBT7904534.1 bifunctional 2-polyprenyl-6-hydroxyphenol methylase/3-demethylubiquinol 3-O-methylt
MSKTQNVDPNEIRKFEELASRWWDRNSEFKPLHDINPLRANWIDSLAPVAEQRILDVGCGGGILCEALAQRGATVTGIDMGEAPLAVGNLHSLESGVSVTYEQSTAEDYATSHAEAFDTVTCLEMLEHVPDPSSVVAACAAMTKPGGTLFFSTINRNPKSYLLAIIGVEYVLRMLPKGTHEYSKFIRPSELGQWIRDAGLEIDQMTGLLYNPITKTYKLDERDVDVNYMICARKPA